MDCRNGKKYIEHQKRILNECKRQIEDIRAEEKINRIRIRNAEAKLESLRFSKLKRKQQICDLKRLIKQYKF